MILESPVLSRNSITYCSSVPFFFACCNPALKSSRLYPSLSTSSPNGPTPMPVARVSSNPSARPSILSVSENLIAAPDNASSACISCFSFKPEARRLEIASTLLSVSFENFDSSCMAFLVTPKPTPALLALVSSRAKSLRSSSVLSSATAIPLVIPATVAAAIFGNAAAARLAVLLSAFSNLVTSFDERLNFFDKLSVDSAAFFMAGLNRSFNDRITLMFLAMFSTSQHVQYFLLFQFHRVFVKQFFRKTQIQQIV